MNGHYLLVLLIVIKPFRASDSLKKHHFASTFPTLSVHVFDSEAVNDDDATNKLEKLMKLLRRHQRDEEELKQNIKQLLLNLHVSNLPNCLTDTTESTVQSKRKALNNVLRMLNLPPNQNDLLSRIISVFTERRNYQAATNDKTYENSQHKQLRSAISKTKGDRITVDNIREDSVNKEIEDYYNNENQIKSMSKEVLNYLNNIRA